MKTTTPGRSAASVDAVPFTTGARPVPAVEVGPSYPVIVEITSRYVVWVDSAEGPEEARSLVDEAPFEYLDPDQETSYSDAEVRSVDEFTHDEAFPRVGPGEVCRFCGGPASSNSPQPFFHHRKTCELWIHAPGLHIQYPADPGRPRVFHAVCLCSPAYTPDGRPGYLAGPFASDEEAKTAVREHAETRFHVSHPGFGTVGCYPKGRKCRG